MEPDDLMDADESEYKRIRVINPSIDGRIISNRIFAKRRLKTG